MKRSSKTEPALTGETSDAGTASAGGGRRKLVMIGGAGVALVVIGLIAFVFLHHGSSRHAPAPQTDASARPSPLYVETPEMITNLDAGPHRLSFAKVQCKLEVEGPQDRDAVAAAMPRIVDMLQTYIRAVRPEEMRSATGAYRLHEALLARAMIVVPEARITDILFEQLLVQ